MPRPTNVQRQAQLDEEYLAIVRRSIRHYRAAASAHARTGDGLRLLWDLLAVECIGIPEEWLCDPANEPRMRAIWEEEGVNAATVLY